MNLSHTTKVTIRKALAALHSIDEAAVHVPLEIEETRVAKKAGFENRADLEQFAKKHHLL